MQSTSNKIIQIEIIKEILVTLCIIAITNVIFYALAQYFGIVRSAVNIDYFLSFLFLVYRRKYLYIISFIVVATVDFLQLFGQVFPVIRLTDLLYLLKFSAISSATYQLFGVCVLIFVILVLFMNIKLSKHISKISVLIVFNILICLMAIINNTVESHKTATNFWKPETKVISSSLVSYINYYNRSFISTANLEGYAFQNVEVSGASEPLWNDEKKDKVLLIVSESWGVPYNKKIQTDVLSPLLALPRVKNAELQDFSFQGYTISGELRELCHKAPAHFNLKNQEEGFEDCLPHQYLSQGYKTVAVHGALGLMYDRKDWYPKAGFKELMFRDSGLNLPNSFCYSFPGNCDKDIMPKILSRFENNNKIFLYWLTLNTHSIYDERDLDKDLFDCGKFNIDNSTSSCRNLKLHKQFFYYLADMLKSDVFLGTRVVIVGDHEPPIISSEVSIFEEKKVPSIVFDVE